MLNPVVLTLPMALTVLVVLAAALAYRRWLDSPIQVQPVTVAPHARHRLADATDAYRPRPWDEVTAEPFMPVRDPLDPNMPLSEVERLSLRLEQVRKHGYTMWSWQNDSDTRELAVVR